MERFIFSISPFLKAFDTAEPTEILLWSIVFINILVAAALLISLFVSKLLAKAREKRNERILLFFEELLSVYLEDEQARESTLHRLQQQLTSTERKELLAKVLVNYKRNFSGDYGRMIKQLYVSLSLQDHSSKKLESRKWNVRAAGISELTQMEITGAANRFIKFLDARESDVRMLAISGLIELTRYDALKHIEEKNYHLSDWEQTIMLERFLSLPKEDIPGIERLLRSENDSIVSFSLHLVKHLNQYQAGPEVIKLLKHPNAEIRKLAVEVAGALLLVDCLPQLISMYPAEAVDTKLTIIGTIGEIGSGSELGFLMQQLNTDDHEIILSAVRAMIRIDPSCGETLEKQKSEKELQSIVAHATDSRI